MQSAGEEPGLRQDLEPVANAHDRAAVGRKSGDRVEHPAEAGDGAGTQVVAVGEAPG